MKLLAIIENIADEYGGPANSLPNLLEAIRAELSIDSVIYSVIKNSNEKNEFINRFSIPWVRCEINGFNKIVYSSGLANRLKDDLVNDDIIFSNNLWNYPAFLSAQLSQKRNIAHIVSIRGTLYPWSLSQGKLRKKIAWYLFQKRALQQAKLVHVTCVDEFKAVRALGVTSPVALVPHGINYDDYQKLPDKHSANVSLSLNNSKKNILFMSRLHKKKGLDLLLEVWPELAMKFPGWCLLIVGPDYSNYTHKINRLATEKDITDNIKVLGMLTGYDKKCALAASEFFVLPSFSENFGVVIGEALAAGLPAITTTETPWSEIESYKCGKYIELSKGNITKALQYMMSLDSESLAKMSNNAKTLIKHNYSWSAQAVKFGKALDFVKSGKPAPNVIFLKNETPDDSHL